eukprot:TRINITY_DN1074_c0_g1_i7.p1 TRINITY_DN1074_c0_g1~~TRINITY_DN1074_c0_g1_i7.p1  ORF type:complete len:348 (-),score=80.19 TRINITY_DN1074_c0_g1_i7:413-1420(-)
MCIRDRDCYIGREAMMKRAAMDLVWPIEGGVVKDWENMNKLWRHTVDNELRMAVGGNPEEIDCHGVLLTDSPTNSKENREKLTKVMFDQFGVDNFYVAAQAVLSLYATGRTTGIVCDCGQSMSHTVPIFEGYAMPHAVQRVNLAGHALTDYLIRILVESNIDLTEAALFPIADQIKEQLCQVSMDFDNEVDVFGGKEKQFQMPDGTSVTVQNQIIRCPELLFRPVMDSLECKGLHELVHKTAMECDNDVRKDLFGNIVMAGGTSMFPFMRDRLQEDVQKKVAESVKVKVCSPPERRVSAWIGGSILSSLTQFKNMWISRSDYTEHGANIVNRVCF